MAGVVARLSELPEENQDVLKKLREMKLGAHIDHTHSISIGRLGEKYYLMIVIDGVDFVWSQTCQVRTNPEDLLHEFLTMSRLTISSIRFDGASEFGKRSFFITYCTQHDIVRESLASYTHIQYVRAEGVIRICKEHVRCLLRSANLPRRFCPDANGLSTWDKLDRLQPHQMCHNLVKDLHVFGSYVTGHLSREHPYVEDTTHDDRAEEGVFLGNDKVMMLSDPKHWDHILSFMQPGDVPHRSLTGCL